MLTLRRHATCSLRRGGPLVVLGAFALTVTMATVSLQAHVGGHGPVDRSALHAWTDPSTGTTVRGSISFVARGVVHVEDANGHLHAWDVALLTTEDQRLVQRFDSRIGTLAHLARADAPGATHDDWWRVVAAALVLAAVTLRRVAPRWTHAMLLAVALSMACGRPATAPSPAAPTASTPSSTPGSPAAANLAAYFDAFPQHVRAWQDGRLLYVESDGMADHALMVGIRSWQQQVPLPQPYRGTNAWTIPVQARLAEQPVSAKTNLFRGAIALAVNGVPIFNALNNRGDDAYLFGELDDFGGHSGRADDYHYHVAPLFLESVVGKARPIAIALDGFLLYGNAEPDGTAVRALDDYNGHADAAATYHYHGTRTYPYINGGMKGVVTVKDGQVDPQPTTTPIRPAGTPLNGATITAWTATGAQAWRMAYSLAGRTHTLDYRIDGNRYTFVFTDPTGATRTETYDR